jgi:topoisomerase IA-like protein
MSSTRNNKYIRGCSYLNVREVWINLVDSSKGETTMAAKKKTAKKKTAKKKTTKKTAKKKR